MSRKVSAATRSHLKGKWRKDPLPSSQLVGNIQFFIGCWMEGLSPLLDFQVEPGLIAVLCGLSVCFIRIRERKRETFLTIPAVTSHRCCPTLFNRSQSLGPDHAKGERSLKSVTIRKWRLSGAVLGTSSFLKTRHI